jgi:protein-tyrosine phosphatase
LRTHPELVGERPPRVAQIGATGHPLELPVRADERTEVGLESLAATFLEHADVPRAPVDSDLGGERERAVAELGRRDVGLGHATAIGTRSAPDETVPPDGVAKMTDRAREVAGTRRSYPHIDTNCRSVIYPAHFAIVRPPTVIEQGRVIAGRHPCAWGPENAGIEVEDLVEQGVTLFVDLTQHGELEPYVSHVEPPTRYLNRPIRDFSIPTRDDLVGILDEIDAELDAGGVAYVHCWAGCGRTGVVVGSGLVRHGVDPNEALRRIAEARGLGCPQTLEQRAFVLGWKAGD